MFFKGNISFAFNLVTTMLSIVFFSGAYLLNTGISMVNKIANAVIILTVYSS